MNPRAKGWNGSHGPFLLAHISSLCPVCLHQVDKTASGLLSTGLCKGDRLGMWGPNSYAWVLIQLATAQAGIILVRRHLPGKAEYVGGGHHSWETPLAPWPQSKTSACLVSDWVVISPEATKRVCRGRALPLSAVSLEGRGAARGTGSAQDTDIPLLSLPGVCEPSLPGSGAGVCPQEGKTHSWGERLGDRPTQKADRVGRACTGG